MQHKAPIDPSSLSRWRNRVGAKRFELLLKIIVETALKMKEMKKKGVIYAVSIDTLPSLALFQVCCNDEKMGVLSCSTNGLRLEMPLACFKCEMCHL